MLRLFLVLAIAGCSSGLDDLLLSGGQKSSARPDMASAKADDPTTPPPEDPPSMNPPVTNPPVTNPPPTSPSPTPSPIVITQCNFFEADTLGQPPAGWTADRGSWLVKEYSGMRTVQQQSSGQNMGDDFSLSYGNRAWTDVTISAHVYTQGYGSDDCVLARYNGLESGYALCAEIDTSTTPLTNRWKLVYKVPGRNNDLKLAQADFTNVKPEHDLSLQVSGSTLIAIVDGVTQPAVQNTALATGSFALTTEVSGTQFGHLCLVHP